jgi:hypothetical protein
MSLLRRLAEGMRLIGAKIMMLNQVYLEEEEVVPITDEKFITVRRAELVGSFDLICDIASASMDDLRSQDLGMILQTTGPDMDPGERRLIWAEIAELKRMPELAQSFRTYKPEPDPMQVKLQEMQIQLLQAQIDKTNAEAEAARSKANQMDIQAELDSTGVTHARDIEKQGAQAAGNSNLEITKHLLTGDTHPSNIEAAVGFDRLIKKDAEMRTLEKTSGNVTQPVQLPGLPVAPPLGQTPLAPLQSAQTAPPIPQSLVLPG